MTGTAERCIDMGLFEGNVLQWLEPRTLANLKCVCKELRMRLTTEEVRECMALGVPHCKTCIVGITGLLDWETKYESGIRPALDKPGIFISYCNKFDFLQEFKMIVVCEDALRTQIILEPRNFGPGHALWWNIKAYHINPSWLDWRNAGGLDTLGEEDRAFMKDTMDLGVWIAQEKYEAKEGGKMLDLADRMYPLLGMPYLCLKMEAPQTQTGGFGWKIEEVGWPKMPNDARNKCMRWDRSEVIEKLERKLWCLAKGHVPGLAKGNSGPVIMHGRYREWIAGWGAGEELLDNVGRFDANIDTRYWWAKLRG